MYSRHLGSFRLRWARFRWYERVIPKIPQNTHRKNANKKASQSNLNGAKSESKWIAKIRTPVWMSIALHFRAHKRFLFLVTTTSESTIFVCSDSFTTVETVAGFLNIWEGNKINVGFVVWCTYYVQVFIRKQSGQEVCTGLLKCM